ncbi:MAG: hypothetical protein LUG93_16965 [Lachnospiraceae bacterium]|nr:hypothetical protein [Lachnospiraceae bacterium]
MANGYKPVIHWITKQEVYERQEMFTARENRPTHADPTATVAIRRVEQETDRLRHKSNKRIAYCPLRTRVWRQDEVGRGGFSGLSENMKG